VHDDIVIWPADDDFDEEPQPPSFAQPSQGRSSWSQKLLLCVFVLTTLVSGVAAYTMWTARSIVGEFRAGDKAVVVAAAEPELGVAPTKPTIGLGDATTFLVVGADRRWGEQGQGRSDTILLVRVDPNRKIVSMLSIPRDVRVNIPGYGQNKVNAAYAYGGPALLTKTLREFLGVRIDHFVVVDFRGFSQIVSELGGVYIPVDARYYHVNDGQAHNNWSSIDLRPGYQKLGRDDALSFVRFRHLDSDLYRAARQQLFLREVGRQVRQRVTDLLSLQPLLRKIAKAAISDLRLSETLRLAETLRNVNPDRINRVTLEASSAMISGGYYLLVSEQQKRRSLRLWANPGSRVGAPPRKKRARNKRSSNPTGVVADGGVGRRYAAQIKGLRVCSPTMIPKGYRWPAQQDAVHRYQLAGKPAAAMYQTAGSGRSVLWMWTTWSKPPVLDSPSETVRKGGRSYDLYWESGKLRQVAWRVDNTRAWITNTLRNELSRSQLLELASSCR
jgi:LCP family protein required for cell wall assembly